MTEEGFKKMVNRPRGIDQLVRVESANLHQQVYAQLREAIMSGKFQPGETLTLRGLAAVTGTSIMPVRDAVLRLIAERALTSVGRSVRIPMLDIDHLKDVERFRVALEGEAAALAAERGTEAEFAEVERANGRMAKARQTARVDRFIAANQQFHFAVYSAAHNDLLRAMIESLWLQIGPHLAYVVEYSVATAFFIDVDMQPHKRLIAALRRRDAEAARKALAADLKDSTDIYRPFAELGRQMVQGATLKRIVASR